MNNVLCGKSALTARRDYRLAGSILTVVVTVLIGYGIDRLPGRGIEAVAPPPARAPSSAPQSTPRATLADLAASTAAESATMEKELEPPAPISAAERKARETEKILQAANAEIRAKRYDEAISMLHRARERIQHDVRSYMALATALEGKKDYDTARDFYGAAINRDPYLADAYWGIATTSEAMGQLDAAIGGMRNFLHVQPYADPQKLRIVQARSALWEWEAKLGRGPWGPTQGIPPGFTADELRRDERGVGVKIPLPETIQPNGMMKYEIKHQDKFQMFKP